MRNNVSVEKIKQLENLIDEMVSSNQEVIDESSASVEDNKIRVIDDLNNRVKLYKKFCFED